MTYLASWLTCSEKSNRGSILGRASLRWLVLKELDSAKQSIDSETTIGILVSIEKSKMKKNSFHTGTDRPKLLNSIPIIISHDNRHRACDKVNRRKSIETIVARVAEPRNDLSLQEAALSSTLTFVFLDALSCDPVRADSSFVSHSESRVPTFPNLRGGPLCCWPSRYSLQPFISPSFPISPPSWWLPSCSFCGRSLFPYSESSRPEVMRCLEEPPKGVDQEGEPLL